MKNFKAALAASAIALSFSSVAQAAFHDPITNASVLQNVAETRKQLSEMEKQFDELKTMNDSLKKNLGGRGNAGLGMREKFDDFNTIVKQLTPTVYSVMDGNGNRPDMGDITEVKSMIDTVFTPTDLPTEISAPVRKHYWQKALKSSLEASEILIESAQRNSKQAAELASQIDQTTSVKEAVDLSNRIQSEMRMLLQQITLILANMARAQAAQDYIGVSDTAKATKRKSTYADEIDKAFGIDKDAANLPPLNMDAFKPKDSMFHKWYK